MPKFNACSLVFYDTEDDNKFMADNCHEYIGSPEDIWQLWFILTNILHKKHVECYNLKGQKQQPNLGIGGVSG